MDYAYQIDAYGGPEALKRVAQTPAPPGPGEARIRQTLVGFNFTDINHRSGRYPVPLPSVLGVEAAGIVESVGAGVANIAPGQRVIYAMSLGAYSSARVIAADKLIAIPDDIPDALAVAAFMKALTAEFLVRRVHAVKAGEIVLVHAAAGGVGAMLCQWAAHLGARVIGVVGAQAKQAFAEANGCEAVLVGADDLAERIRAIAPDGVDVAYDSVGHDTFFASLKSLRPHGLFVSFGSASGMLPAFDLNELPAHGAPFLTRAAFGNYFPDKSQVQTSAEAVFSLLRPGVLRPRIGGLYALAEVSACHADAEARTIIGSSLLEVGQG